MIRMFFVAFLYTLVVISHTIALNETSSLKGKINVVHDFLNPDVEQKVKTFSYLAKTIVPDIDGEVYLKCTAIVISEYTILGPAFCVYDEKTNSYYIKVIACISTESYALKRSIAHPGYIEKGKDYECYDIAVSKLSRNCKLPGAKLPGPTDEFKLDEVSTIIGTYMDSHTIKWGLEVRILNELQCWYYLRFIVSMPSSDIAQYLLCANQMTENEKIMKSDVGSPVIQNDTVIGIIAGTLYQNIPDKVLLIKLFEHREFIIEKDEELRVKVASQSKNNRRTHSSHKPSSAIGKTKKRCI